MQIEKKIVAFILHNTPLIWWYLICKILRLTICFLIACIRYEISWKFLGMIIFLIIFVSITQFINYMPIYKTWNYGDQSWLGYLLNDRIGEGLSRSIILLIFVIIPCSLAYLLNPMIKDIFSTKTVNCFDFKTFV